jgi:glycosyltransferase involved in cell wall biosynthesis
MTKYWIIMPVYNEEEAVPKVIHDWLPVLRNTLGSNFTFCAINDGSKDGTLTILNGIAAKEKELKVVDKVNTGHGQSCVFGYKLALENGAEWIFQMDSDGQCDPKYFPQLIGAAEKGKVVYGFRKTRDDGTKRYLISRVVSLFAYLATGVWVKDANVPYRLMHRSTLENYVNKIPDDFHLANILLSVIQQKFFGIKWVTIHFLNRAGGTPSVKAYSFAKHGIKLFRQLSQNNNRLKQTD